MCNGGVLVRDVQHSHGLTVCSMQLRRWAPDYMFESALALSYLCLVSSYLSYLASTVVFSSYYSWVAHALHLVHVPAHCVLE